MTSRIVFSFLVLCLALACSKDPYDDFPSSEPDVFLEDCTPIPANTHPRAAEFQAVLDRFQAKGFPSLSAYVSSAEGNWQGSAGFAGVQNAQAPQSCHLYYSGSVAKMYTVVAALQLVELDSLGLDDRIDEHLPSILTDQLPNGHGATIRQLMNHTSGIPDHDDEEGLEDFILNNDGNLPPPAEQLAFLFDNDPWFAPGTSIRYSSANTVVLALIIDRFHPDGHAGLIQDNIIDRLNLTETFYQNGVQLPTLVNVYGHDLVETPLYNLNSWARNYAHGSHGDAGIIASVGDYFRFLRGVNDGTLLAPDMLAAMRAPEILGTDSAGNFEATGLGLIIGHWQGHTRMGHSGATVGGASNIYYYLETDAYLVVTSNFSPEFNEGLTNLFYNGTIINNDFLLGGLETVLLE